MRHGRLPDHGIDTAPLDHSHEVQGVKRQRMKTAIGSVGVVLVLLAGLFIIQKFQAKRHPQPKEPKAAPAQTLAQTQEPFQKLREDLSGSYAGIDRRPKEPEVRIVREVQAAEVTPPPTQTAALPPTQPPPAQRTQTVQQQPQPQRQVQAGTATQKPEKPAWRLAGKSKAFEPYKPPQPTDEEKRQAGKLIPPVAWEVPEDKHRVIYRDTVIHGQLMGAVNSDTPTDIKIKVTRPVTSRFDPAIILLPQETHLIGVQDGTPEFGMRRLPVKIVQAILPDGQVMAFDQATLGDKHGAGGLKSKVNNHWPQLILATGLTAILNIGTRAPFGDTQGYQPTLPQQYSQEFGQGMSQATRPIIGRQVGVKPTLTAKAGDPITMSLGQNLSLQTPPVLVQQ